ncbi:receptor-transporting protein 3-like [Astyanax mexicanus]|uniref:Receptor transporter protein 3 n=1 Tax=Astyanax mexicanus TaxID=7994 RepID=A0A8B9K343_ASTMX|nr:receptor-transporting protein 3-like [Astyanax mexicanus]
MAEQWSTIFRNHAAGLRGDQWTLELDDSIKPGQQGYGWNQYIQSAFADFDCSMCSHRWSSGRVQVVFHFTLNSSLHRGTVKVRRFRQECRDCGEEQMEEPSFSSQNIDVMLEKLMKKIKIRFYGENPPDSKRDFYFDGRIEGPHESDHCEACKSGICQQGSEYY